MNRFYCYIHLPLRPDTLANFTQNFPPSPKFSPRPLKTKAISARLPASFLVQVSYWWGFRPQHRQKRDECSRV